MVGEREIFGGKELMDFFCKDSVENDKEYCKFIIIFARKPTSLQLVGSLMLTMRRKVSIQEVIHHTKTEIHFIMI